MNTLCLLNLSSTVRKTLQNRANSPKSRNVTCVYIVGMEGYQKITAVLLNKIEALIMRYMLSTHMSQMICKCSGSSDHSIGGTHSFDKRHLSDANIEVSVTATNHSSVGRVGNATFTTVNDRLMAFSRNGVEEKGRGRFIMGCNVSSISP